MTVYIDKRYFNETSFKRDLFSTLLQEDLFSNQVVATCACALCTTERLFAKLKALACNAHANVRSYTSSTRD